jgi:hypothetical protein
MLEERFSSQLRARSDSGDYVVNDAQLTNYLQNPGTIPSFMVLAEIERRQAEKVRKEQMQAQPQQPTVKDQAIMALGQQMPQGMAMPPEQVAMTPEQRAGSGIAALNPPVQMAEGGVVGYRAGDYVSKKLFGGRSLGDMYTDPEGMYRDSDLANLQESRLKKIQSLRDTKGAIFPSSLIGEPDSITGKEVVAKERLQALEDEGLVTIPGGYVPEGSPFKTDEEVLMDKIEAQEKADKKAAEDKLLSDKNKTFEGAKLSTGKFNTMPYDELMIENPEEYGRTLKEELRAELGEDDYKKLEKEQLGDLEKRIGGREGKKFGMAALFAGAKMMSSKDPFFAQGLGAGLEEGAKFLTQEQKEIEALKSQKLDIQTKLRIADRKEKEALNKFGAQSEQFARANNMKVSLEQQSNMLKQEELDIKRPYYESQSSYLKSLSAQTGLAKEKEKYISDRFPAGTVGLQALGTLREKKRDGSIGDKALKRLNELESQYKALEAEANAKFPSVGGNSSATSYTDTMRTANPLRYLGQE